MDKRVYKVFFLLRRNHRSETAKEKKLASHPRELESRIRLVRKEKNLSKELCLLECRIYIYFFFFFESTRDPCKGFVFFAKDRFSGSGKWSRAHSIGQNSRWQSLQKSEKFKRNFMQYYEIGKRVSECCRDLTTFAKELCASVSRVLDTFGKESSERVARVWIERWVDSWE